MPRDDEHLDQSALIAWCRHGAAAGVVDAPDGGRRRLTGRQRLALDVTHSSLNGVRLGKRQRGRAKAAGMLAGVPDVFVPYPTATSAGLFVEMKTRTGSKSKAQKKVTADLASLGYAVVIARGYNPARRAILDHFDLS